MLSPLAAYMCIILRFRIRHDMAIAVDWDVFSNQSNKYWYM